MSNQSHHNVHDVVLTKPHLEPLDSNTQRIRRNLLLMSAFAIVLVRGDPSGNFRIAGVQFTGLNTFDMYVFTLIAIVYLMIHFLWVQRDYWYEHKIRLTGVKTEFNKPKDSYQEAMYSLDANVAEQRQSSLMSWWVRTYFAFSDSKVVDNAIDRIMNSDDTDEQKKRRILTYPSMLSGELAQRSNYINIALKRFDQAFYQHQLSQVSRWIIMDMGVPVLFALLALGMLCYRWFVWEGYEMASIVDLTKGSGLALSAIVSALVSIIICLLSHRLALKVVDYRVQATHKGQLKCEIQKLLFTLEFDSSRHQSSNPHINTHLHDMTKGFNDSLLNYIAVIEDRVKNELEKHYQTYRKWLIVNHKDSLPETYESELKNIINSVLDEL